MKNFDILYEASVQKIIEREFFFRSGLVWQSYAPFFDSAAISIKSCQHDILRTDSARILISGVQVRVNI